MQCNPTRSRGRLRGHLHRLAQEPQILEEPRCIRSIRLQQPHSNQGHCGNHEQQTQNIRRRIRNRRRISERLHRHPQPDQRQEIRRSS